MTHFGDRLTEANRRTATPLCMGIDPHISMIPAIFGDAQDGAASDAAIRAIDDFSMACLEPVSYTHLTLPTIYSV